jgi:hypothetical protein
MSAEKYASRDRGFGHTPQCGFDCPGRVLGWGDGTHGCAPFSGRVRFTARRLSVQPTGLADGALTIDLSSSMTALRKRNPVFFLAARGA